MWEDPIVKEVHQTREELAPQHNFDVKAIFADLRKRQVSLGDRLIPQKPRVESRAEADRGNDSASEMSPSSKATPAG
jgi:hypothetical protein